MIEQWRKDYFQWQALLQNREPLGTFVRTRALQAIPTERFITAYVDLWMRLSSDLPSIRFLSPHLQTTWETLEDAIRTAQSFPVGLKVVSDHLVGIAEDGNRASSIADADRLEQLWDELRHQWQEYQPALLEVWNAWLEAVATEVGWDRL